VLAPPPDPIKKHLPSLALTLTPTTEPKNGHGDDVTLHPPEWPETECGIGGSRSQGPPPAARCYPSYGYPHSDYHMREFPPHPYGVAMLGAPICSLLSWARKTAPKGGFRDFEHRHRKKRLLEARTALIYTSDDLRYLLKSNPTLTRKPATVRALSMSYGHPPRRFGPSG